MSDLLVRHGPKLAVGGLVVLNVVLIGALALRDPVRTAVPATPVSASSSMSPSPSATPSTSTAEPTLSEASSTPGATPSDAPSTTPSPSPSTSPSQDQSSGNADAQPRLLAANSGRVAWRATSTGCEGSAVVEVTTNGGRSWAKTKPGLTAIVRLKAYGDTAVFAVGADKKCRPTYAWVRGPKQSWQRDQGQVGDVWYRTPKDLDEVHAPGGRKTRPCGRDLVDLAGLGTAQAAVLCADGRIRTDAAGRSWRTVQKHSGAISLNADDAAFVAATSRPDCPGVVVQRFDSSGLGLGSSRGSCRSKAKASGGDTAVAQRFGDVWLWTGARVTVS